MHTTRQCARYNRFMHMHGAGQHMAHHASATTQGMQVRAAPVPLRGPFPQPHTLVQCLRMLVRSCQAGWPAMSTRLMSERIASTRAEPGSCCTRAGTEQHGCASCAFQRMQRSKQKDGHGVQSCAPILHRHTPQCRITASTLLHCIMLSTVLVPIQLCMAVSTTLFTPTCAPAPPLVKAGFPP